MEQSQKEDSHSEKVRGGRKEKQRKGEKYNRKNKERELRRNRKKGKWRKEGMEKREIC